MQTARAKSGRRTADAVREAVAALDLELVKRKLTDGRDGPGWTREEAEVVDIWYRRFLIILVKYPDRALVPSRRVDEMWHQHILDTKKYARDCRAMCGRFIHHYPYFGMRSEEEAAERVQALAETERLYLEEFGESPFTCPGSCKASCCGRCDAGISEEGG